MAIQIRRGSNAEWETNNSNIVVGEPAVATDSKRAFIGTASGAYMELANLEAIAPAYDPGNNYMIGDYVSYQGKLYVCTVPTSGAWNASAWQVTTLGQALAENAYSNYETYTMNGDIVSFPNGAGGVPVKDLKVGIEAVQSGSGDPSPTNVRPISGWDEVNVTRTGKNWLIFPYLATTGTYHGVPATVNSDGTIILNGTSTEQGDIILISYTGADIDKGWTGSFILTSGVANDDVTINARVRNTSSATNRYVTSSNGVATVSTGENEVINQIYLNVKNAKTFSNVVVYPMLRLSTETDATYEPYKGQTYTTDLDGTRYGGTLDVTTGVLTVTHGIVDLGSLTWTYNSTYSLFAATASSDTPTISNNGANDVICEAYKHYYTGSKIVLANIENGSIVLNTGSFSSSKRWLIKNTDYTDGATFKTSLNGVHAVYELATPTTVQLTPQQVRTVLHENNIWADSGEVEVTYRISNVQ